MRARPRRSTTLAAATLAASLLGSLPTPSLAETPEPAAPAAAGERKIGPAASEDLKAARAKVRQAAKEARETVTAARQEAREKLDAARSEAQGKVKAAHADVKAKLGTAREELREKMHETVDQVLGPPEDRAERAREARRSRMHALRAHWKRGADIPPPVREELQKHARRTARLQRIRALAEANGDVKSVERCDELLELERAHHDKRMERLRPKLAAPRATPVEAADDKDDEKAPEEEAAEDQP